MIPANTITKLKVWQVKAFPMFLLTLILCIILSFLILQPVLKMGLTGDDWQLLFAYKTYDPKPINRILDVWIQRGPYTTSQFFYIGFLESLFGLDYQLFQIISLSFKIFASITLFLLISKVFKDYFLASVSAVIFSIIHSSAGALQYVVKGSEYLAIGFMNLFFLFYYYGVTKVSKRVTLLSSIILFITFMLSPIRMYPLFGLIFLIEIYLAVKKKKISYLLQSFFRLIVFYLPVIFLAIAGIGTNSGYFNGIISIINDLKGGNWHLFLLPLKGLGYTLLGNDQLNLLHSPAHLIGILILVCCSICFIIWIRRQNKLDKIFLIFFGPYFAFFFLVSTLVIIGPGFNIIASLHWYLIIPSLGISVFISGLICSVYEQWVKLKEYRYLFMAVSLLIIISFVSYYETNRHFNSLLGIGTGAADQTYMQNQILNSIDNQNQLNLIVYLEQSKEPTEQRNTQYYAVALNTGHFGHWFFYFKKPEFLGCTTVVTDKNQLREFYKLKERGYFEADGLCAETRYNIGVVKTIYEIGDFRAFMLKDKKMSNITDKILQDLRSK